MHWLLYLPAIASPIAVVAAYLLLKVSAQRLRERFPAAPAAAHATDGALGDVVVEGAPEDMRTINVAIRPMEHV